MSGARFRSPIPLSFSIPAEAQIRTHQSATLAVAASFAARPPGLGPRNGGRAHEMAVARGRSYQHVYELRQGWLVIPAKPLDCQQHVDPTDRAEIVCS
jgi:hypothetical protein